MFKKLDGQPSTCTLLFDPKDADTVFFLQSLNQLSDQDLRNVFISTRNIRQRTFGDAREDWFWVTPNEIGEVMEDWFVVIPQIRVCR